MSSRGSLMGKAISILQWKDGDLRLLCEVWGVLSTPSKKRTSFIKVWLCCPSSYFGWDDDAVLSLIFLLDPASFTGPQTKSCKSIKSSERSTGFGCDNDLQKTTNGERMCLKNTHAHVYTWTQTSVLFHTSLLQASWAISTLILFLTGHILRQLQIEVAAPVIMWQRGADGGHWVSCWKPRYPAWVPGFSG